MRRPIMPLALVLAVATGLVLGELGPAVIPPPEPAETAGLFAANAATVRRFYDAVEGALRTGDTAPLDALLTADFVEHAAHPGQTSDRDGLARYLRALHRSAPSLAVTADDIVAQGDRVAVRVRVDGVDDNSAGGLPPVTGRMWGTFDLFRLREGRIAEHWGDDLGLAITEPLLEVGVDVTPPAEKWVEVGRLTYPPGGAQGGWTSGPTIISVEEGSLTVAYDAISPEAATLVPAAAPRRDVASGETVALEEGDTLALTSGSFFEVRNHGTLPGTALVIWSGEPIVPQCDDPALPQCAGSTDATPGALASGVTYATLAGGMSASLPKGRASVAIERVAVSSGAAVASHRIAVAEFVVVEAGQLALDVEGGRAWSRPGPQDVTRAVTGGTATTDTIAATGAGLAFDADTTVGFAPDGDEPLVALVIVIGPEFVGNRPAS